MKLKTKQKVKLDNIEKYPYAPFSVYGDLAWNKTGSWRYVRPVYVESVPPCQAGCPTGENVEAWIKLLAQKKYTEAIELIRLENPFPSITGRVCFHPCENRCNRSHMGGSVSINMLEQFVADQGMELPPTEGFGMEGGLNVAVIGSGPAGLAAAYHLTRLGHKVEVFESSEQLGGMLRYGIPSYRLPRAILDKELNRLRDMGITFHTGTKADANELLERFDRVLVAAGAQANRNLEIGDDIQGVMHGLDFLKQANSGKTESVSGRVAVIGGGNTAMDCARVALRLGAEDVTVYYRRTRAQMPAFAEEIDAAQQEGVKFIFLRSPKAFEQKDNRINVRFQVMQLGVPGADGRRKPVPVEGQFESFDADLVLMATGEVVDGDGFADLVDPDAGVIRVDQAMRTSNPRVFAAGDVTQGPRTVTDALGMGKTAAIIMDAQFRELDVDKVIASTSVPTSKSLTMAYYLEFLKGQAAGHKLDVVEFERLNPYHFTISPRPKRPMLDLDKRMDPPKQEVFAEINQTIPEDLALRESDRCMHCGRCIDCDNCYIYCPDGAITPKPGGGYVINMDFCKGCGVCVRECPRAAMDMVEEPVEF